MHKVTKIDYEEILEKDELEKKDEQLSHKKKNRKKRRRKKQVLFVSIILGIFALYLLSDYSNITVVIVDGSTLNSKQEIMNIGKVSYGEKSIFNTSSAIEKRLEEHVFIESAKVSKSWDGVVHIQIEEKRILGYYIEDDKKYLLVEGKDPIAIDEKVEVAHLPYLFDLTEEQKQAYMKACQDVEIEYLSLISEVKHYETTYDNNMLELVMQDGHIVFTSMDGLSLLNWYTTTIKGVSSADKCIMFIEETNTITTQTCDKVVE